MNTPTARHITYKAIEELRSLPGSIHIRINRLDGYFVPFVFYTPPEQAPIGHGPIVQDDSLVASLDLEPLVKEIRKTLGKIEIYAPTTPGPGRVLH